MRILACYNMKGGVGKTTSAVNLAFCAAESGARVLLWDLDPQGAATFHLGVEAVAATKLKKLFKDKRSLSDWAQPTPYPGLDVVPAGFGYRHLDVELGESKKSCRKFAKAFEGMAPYDYVFLDCPPSISALSEGVFCAADALLMPLTPSPLSRQTFERVRTYLAEGPEGAAEDDKDRKHKDDKKGKDEKKGKKDGKSGKDGKNADEDRADAADAPVLPIHAFFTMVDRRKTLHRAAVLASLREPEFCETSIPLRADVEAMGLRRAPLAAFAPDSDAALAYRALWAELTRRLSA
ncbi:MAG: AAA family ATPase [Desulfovibrionaceae bacterium]|jgi:cellulose biosynthesis protein BcsQ|nr:AAA family ATPase [Desulfovibrionaceae bacterium]